MSRNIYTFSWDEISETIDFCRDYSLSKSKTKSQRTSGGESAFGGIMDRFIAKGLPEVAACQIIGKYTSTKKLLHDATIRPTNKDPDIHAIYDEAMSIKREPNLHIEVKLLRDNFNWLPAREEQITEYGGNDEDYYMVYVSLYFEDESNKRKNDVTGSIMREVIDSSKFNLNNFSSISNLRAEIAYICNRKLILAKGFYAPAGTIMPYTNLEIVKKGVFSKNGVLFDKFKSLKNLSGVNNYKMKPDPQIIDSENLDLSLFENWQINGDVSIYKNTVTNTEVIYANKESIVEQQNIGKFVLEKGQTYKFFLNNALGRRGKKEQTKGTDEYMISATKLRNINSEGIGNSIEEIIKNIAEKI